MIDRPPKKQNKKNKSSFKRDYHISYNRVSKGKEIFFPFFFFFLSTAKKRRHLESADYFLKSWKGIIEKRRTITEAFNTQARTVTVVRQRACTTTIVHRPLLTVASCSINNNNNNCNCNINSNNSSSFTRIIDQFIFMSHNRTRYLIRSRKDRDRIPLFLDRTTAGQIVALNFPKSSPT